MITEQIREEVIRRSDEWNKKTGYYNWKQHMSLVVDNAIRLAKEYDRGGVCFGCRCSFTI